MANACSIYGFMSRTISVSVKSGCVFPYKLLQYIFNLCNQSDSKMMKTTTLFFGLLLFFNTNAQGKLKAYDYVYKQTDIVDYVVQKNGHYGIFHNHKELLAPIYDSIGIQKGPTPIVIKNEGRYSIFVAGSDFKLYSTGGSFDEFHAGSTFSIGIDKGVCYYLYSGKVLRAKKLNAKSSVEETYLLNTQKSIVLMNVDNNEKHVVKADSVNEQLLVSYPYFLLSTNHPQRFTILDITNLECELYADANNRSVELVKVFKNGDSASSQVKLFLKVRSLYSESIYHLAFESILQSEKDSNGVWIDSYLNDFMYLTSAPVDENEKLVLSLYSEAPEYIQIDKLNVTTNVKTKVGYVYGLQIDDPSFHTFAPYTRPIYSSGGNWGFGLFWWGAK